MDSIDSSLNSFWKGRYHLEPRLFNNNHFLGTQKVHIQHGVVVQTNDAVSSIGIFFSVVLGLDGTIVTVAARCWITPLSSTNMSFWKYFAMMGQCAIEVNNTKCTKRSLPCVIQIKNVVSPMLQRIQDMWPRSIPSKSRAKTSLGRAKVGQFLLQG
jgi:hypothetical protein